MFLSVVDTVAYIIRGVRFVIWAMYLYKAAANNSYLSLFLQRQNLEPTNDTLFDLQKSVVLSTKIYIFPSDVQFHLKVPHGHCPLQI